MKDIQGIMRGMNVKAIEIVKAKCEHQDKSKIEGKEIDTIIVILEIENLTTGGKEKRGEVIRTEDQNDNGTEEKGIIRNGMM